MDAQKFTTMMTDQSLIDLKKMQYKYTPEAVSEFVLILKDFFFKTVFLPDFKGNSLVYLDQQVKISLSTAKILLKKRIEKSRYSSQAMTDEIQASLLIENIQSSRESIRYILNGYAPRSKDENQLYGMKKGLDYISSQNHPINEENIHTLYQMMIGDYLEAENKLLSGRMYRHDSVYLMSDKVEHQGLPADKLPQAMAQFVAFIQRDEMDELLKAIVIHFYIGYLHPYFDGNGRMARMMQLWYLVSCGYSSTLFVPFSKHIEISRKKYYQAFTLVEKNAEISGVLDITPFLLYFIENVYHQIPQEESETQNLLGHYQDLLAEGQVTEKESALYSFVLSVYGHAEFSTKQLEKDFKDAAYATIRSFVLKFTKLGLLTSQKYGNRNRYRIPD